jgi:hypothetical protein
MVETTTCCTCLSFHTEPEAQSSTLLQPLFNISLPWLCWWTLRRRVWLGQAHVLWCGGWV